MVTKLFTFLALVLWASVASAACSMTTKLPIDVAKDITFKSDSTGYVKWSYHGEANKLTFEQFSSFVKWNHDASNYITCNQRSTWPSRKNIESANARIMVLDTD